MLMTLGKAGGDEAPDGLFPAQRHSHCFDSESQSRDAAAYAYNPIVKRASVSAGWRMPGYWD